MKTPYDTALRVRKRELDEVRIALARETGILAEIDRDAEALREEMAREGQLACAEWGAEWGIASHAYLQRKRLEDLGLRKRREASLRNAELLRRRAIEAHGPMRAVERVADRFRGEEQRRRARADQQRADEQAASGFRRRKTVERRNPASRP